jgi:hypothetical protein
LLWRIKSNFAHAKQRGSLAFIPDSVIMRNLRQRNPGLSRALFIYELAARGAPGVAARGRLRARERQWRVSQWP